MSASALDVFALRENVIDDYRRFATSFTTIQAEDIRSQVEAIYAQGRYWPEPLIQLNPRFEDGKDISTLVGEGVLTPGCERIFCRDGQPLKLYRHQTEALSIASSGESYVVTTGTGSGKSLCFFIPLVSHILAQKQRDPRPRTRAIIIYPMNALANSQLEEFGKFFDHLSPPHPVTFARYTGQETTAERKAIADAPPDILLTNFMMFELLMTRQDAVDRQVIQHCNGLEFLVLDELHTYRGRQGADVAMLVRRIREYLVSGKLQCIGTSATMVSSAWTATGSSSAMGRCGAPTRTSGASERLPRIRAKDSRHPARVRACLRALETCRTTPESKPCGWWSGSGWASSRSSGAGGSSGASRRSAGS